MPFGRKCITGTDPTEMKAIGYLLESPMPFGRKCITGVSITTKT